MHEKPLRLWNTKRLKLASSLVKDGKKIFEPRIVDKEIHLDCGIFARCPMYARFEPVNGGFFEFRLINIHIHFGKNTNTEIRPWSFCEIFTESHIDHFEPLNELFKFRKELMKYTLAFGGDKIYYLDDQSKVLNGVGQGGEWDLSWHDFEKFVADKSFPLMLNIPQFITDKDYRKEFIEKKAYPLSFIDDFSDIK